MERLEFFKQLTEATGLPGYEHDVRCVLEQHIAPLAQLDHDNLGSLIASKVGDANGPKIMLAGHMDEIGFMVTQITDNGFLRFQTLGGWWEQVMLAQRVMVKTRKGDLPGVIGSKPPHVLSPEERKKVVEKRDMYIDIGVGSKAEAEEKGVLPGDPVVPICPFTVMANEKYLMAKAWDNRFGCAVVVEVLKALQNEPHPNVFYGVATVQEEVGLRGAQTSANAISPDIGFALDVSIAGDTPGMRPNEATAELGKGPVVMLYDASMVPHVGLRNLVLDVAKDEGIAVQFDALAAGGTDAGRIHLQGKGVPSLVLCVPTRYIHSHASIIHYDDFDATVKLITAVIKKLDWETVRNLTR
jgi:putative aminopeptidase FrvX